MDTVLRCDDCGAEMRYNYAPVMNSGYYGLSDEALYSEFIEDCIADAEEDHECVPHCDGCDGHYDDVLNFVACIDGVDEDVAYCEECARMAVAGYNGHTITLTPKVTP